MVQNGMDMHSGRQSMRPRRRCVVKESAFLILYWRYHSSAFRNSGRSRKAGDFSRLRRQETMLGQAGCLADGIDPAVGIRQIAPLDAHQVVIHGLGDGADFAFVQDHGPVPVGQLTHGGDDGSGAGAEGFSEAAFRMGPGRALPRRWAALPRESPSPGPAAGCSSG